MTEATDRTGSLSDSEAAELLEKLSEDKFEWFKQHQEHRTGPEEVKQMREATCTCIPSGEVIHIKRGPIQEWKEGDTTVYLLTFWDDEKAIESHGEVTSELKGIELMVVPKGLEDIFEYRKQQYDMTDMNQVDLGKLSKEEILEVLRNIAQVWPLVEADEVVSHD